MASSVRPRRSVLYMPGSNARALEKAKTLAADGLILDLEDAVAPDAKAIARQQVTDAVKGGGYGPRELIIRVNGLDTPWARDDLAAAAAAGPDAILIPKVESATMVAEAEALIAAAPAHTTLWVMMETPRGILRAEEIAGASPRLAALVLGTSDLAKDTHAHHTALRLPFLYSLSVCVLAARANNLTVLDGVYLDLKDNDGFVAACRQGLELGFDGKTLIHPDQLAGANEVFAPTAAQVAQARKIVAAYEAAEAEGKGVVVVDGRLVEKLHVVEAQRQIALADAIAAMG